MVVKTKIIKSFVRIKSIWLRFYKSNNNGNYRNIKECIKNLKTNENQLKIRSNAPFKNSSHYFCLFSCQSWHHYFHWSHFDSWLAVPGQKRVHVTRVKFPIGKTMNLLSGLCFHSFWSVISHCDSQFVSQLWNFDYWCNFGVEFMIRGIFVESTLLFLFLLLILLNYLFAF